MLTSALALLVYDWFLCLGQEVRFIWKWHTKITGTSLVYAFSRYAVLMLTLLSVATNYPMSDLVRSLAPPLSLDTLNIVYVEVPHRPRLSSIKQYSLAAVLQLQGSNMVPVDCHYSGYDVL